MQTNEILICGSGAMAVAMGEGLRASGFAVRYVVRDLACTHSAAARDCISYEQAEFAGRAVILAFKAPGFAALAPRLKDAALVLSAAAAISAAELAECGADYIARIMPNIAARYGASASTIFRVAGGAAEHERACEIVRGFGSCTEVASEAQLLAAMGINGCSPAWLALVADGLAIGAASGGLPHEQARALAAASIKSAALLLEHMSPDALITSVCSPGGVTLKGLCVLEESAIRSAFARAVTAAK